MMPEEMLDEGLPFRPDFAARVLDEADAIIMRRRRTRWTAAAASAAVVASLAMFAMWGIPAVPPSGVERIPKQVAATGLGDMYFAQRTQMEPMDVMFPEARPLAQFLEQYGDGDSAIEDDAVFFPNAKDDTSEEVDGS